MTGVNLTQAAVAEGAQRRRAMRLRLSMADHLVWLFAACAGLPVGMAIGLWALGAPLLDFTSPFPYSLVLAFLGAIAVFDHRVRRRLQRLERLQANARAAAARLNRASGAVPAIDGDELDQLTVSFESLTEQLHEQLQSARTIHEIGRSVLSTLDSAEIVETVLVRAGEISSCQAVVVGLSPAAGPNAGWTFRGKAMTGALGPANVIRPTVAEVEELWSRGEEFTVDCLEGSRSYLNLDAIARCGIQHFLVFPFFRDGTISGLLGLGYTSTPDTAGHDAGRIRRFVDQVTVALSNARLVEEVSDLNWGTVRALARTIDAISPWTAGHSERVTGLALSVGRELGLSKRKLDVLHRGGLLHDIGKIAIDPAILNKEGRLDDNEFAIMQRHPALGAEILAPVPQYADVLPIVLHHHEKIDGTGYPHGLRGNNIPFLARILAVADVYDALRSPRPYRPSLTEAEVVEEIRKMSGTHLDRLVVDAFLKVKGRQEPRENAEIPELTLDLQAFYARTD